VHRTVRIDVNHITRVEGHGSIVVRASDGTVHEVEWLVPEAPRFFEAMVRGRSHEDIQTIVSRICGICSFAHSFSAVKAIEDAFGIEVSEQTNKLRILTYYGEQIESHVLHIGYLAAPDFFGVRSVVPLISAHPDMVRKIINLHKLGNDWMEMFGGRRTHPVTIQPGGFTRYPTEEMLRSLGSRIEDCLPDLEAVAEAVLSVAGAIPGFERETEYVALVHPDGYPFYEGRIGSSDTPETVDVHEFERVANEYVSPQSTAKWAKWHRDSYMVGALARFNLNADRLLPLAKKTAKLFGLEKGCANPYMNTIAQVVEVAQCLEHGLRLIDELLAKCITPEKRRCEPPPCFQGGEGVGCVEAPRGILFHRYSFDRNGICAGGDIRIPTGQNHANIQKDFEKLVRESLDQGEDRLKLRLEMLVRAYDPCISCSTH
jgi:coenzyme F420-reducing hydrogenase alpha subunit